MKYSLPYSDFISTRIFFITHFTCKLTIPPREVNSKSTVAYEKGLEKENLKESFIYSLVEWGDITNHVFRYKFVILS